MFRRWSVVALTAAALVAPATARASEGWAWPVAGDPVLMYGAAYAAIDGRACTHGGLDIDAAAGTEVRASAPGEVAFSGLVPAGEGARAWAVTVLTGDGLRVTYLPLATASARRGQAVSAGQALGTLAGSGDLSGGGPHLHLGVKRGGASLDPLAFLGPRASTAPVATGARSVGGNSGARLAVPTTAAGALRAPVRSASAAPAAVAEAAAAPAVRGALHALSLAPALGRVEPFAATPALDLEAVRSDWDAVRALLASIAVRLGLVLVAAGCAWPVIRVARDAGSRAARVVARDARR
jgi:hypothetical protein